jgi:hypothetical protein
MLNIILIIRDQPFKNFRTAVFESFDSADTLATRCTLKGPHPSAFKLSVHELISHPNKIVYLNILMLEPCLQNAYTCYYAFSHLSRLLTEVAESPKCNYVVVRSRDTLAQIRAQIICYTVQSLQFIHSSMAVQPLVGPWPDLQFRDPFYTDGMTSWTSDQPVARPLPTHRKKLTQNKRAQTSIP